jgi:prepilin-type N-terminal cleavage/methylation domain-containing protein
MAPFVVWKSRLPKAPYRKSAGFSLIEILISLGIIGVLVSISVPAYERNTERQKVRTAVVDIQVPSVVLKGIELDNREYPEELPMMERHLNAAVWLGSEPVAELEHAARWMSCSAGRGYLKAYDSVSAARQGLNAYLAFYNARRPHQAQ